MLHALVTVSRGHPGPRVSSQALKCLVLALLERAALKRRTTSEGARSGRTDLVSQTFPLNLLLANGKTGTSGSERSEVQAVSGLKIFDFRSSRRRCHAERVRSLWRSLTVSADVRAAACR
jgi:hypothetical protein